MTKELLLMPGLFKTYHPLVDGSMNLTFQTQEITDRNMKNLVFDLHRQFGWILFSPNEIQMDAVPEDPANPPSGDSPSKRLKNTIYALYMKKDAPYGATGFDKFYQEQVERFRSIILTDLSALDR